MDPKKIISLYGATGILILVGIAFLLKGILTKNITLIILGVLLFVMGVARLIMVKKLLKEHDDN